MCALLDAAVNDAIDRRARSSRSKCALLLRRHRLGYILFGLSHPERNPALPMMRLSRPLIGAHVIG